MAYQSQYSGSEIDNILTLASTGSNIDLDKTLTLEDNAADAKAVGDAINSLNEEITSLSEELSSEISQIQTNLNAKANTANVVLKTNFVLSGTTLTITTS